MPGPRHPAARSCQVVTTFADPADQARISPEPLGHTERHRPPTAPQNSTQHPGQNLSRSPRSRLSRVRGLRDAPRGLHLRFARPHSAPSPSFLRPGCGRVRPPLPALWVATVGTCAGLSRALLFPAYGQANTASPSAGARPVPVPTSVDISPPGPPLGGAWPEIPIQIAPPAPPHGGVADLGPFAHPNAAELGPRRDRYLDRHGDIEGRCPVAIRTVALLLFLLLLLLMLCFRRRCLPLLLCLCYWSPPCIPSR